MSKEKTIIEKAIEEREAINKAAEDVAKNKLVEEMTSRFTQLLNEAKKDLDKKEPLNENKDSEEKKEEVENKENTEEKKDGEKKEEPKEEKVNENVDLTDNSLKEIEDEFDNASAEDNFDIQNDTIDLEQLEQELENLENINAETEETENVEQIPAETEVSTEEPAVEENVNDPYNQLKKIIEDASNVLKNMENQKQIDGLSSEFDNMMSEMYGESYKDDLGENYETLKEKYISKKTGTTEAEPVNESTEEEEKIVDEVVDNNPEEKPEVDETHGVGLSQQKGVSGDQLPQPEYADYKKHKLRYALQNENLVKKLNNQLAENKKLTKKLNELREGKKKVDGMLKEYNDVLVKYRAQLTEMAVFNTNLSHTNNLLVNEELALTFDDKVKIINEFKEATTISESEDKYKKMLVDLKTTKKPIEENVEEKLTKSVDTSSKNKLDESIKEKTALGADKHLEKIKNTFKYIENK
jgi:hypothetical protein